MYQVRRSKAKTAQTAVDSANKIIDVTNPEAAKEQERNLKRLRTLAKAAFTRWETAQERVLILEDELNISSTEERWQPGSQEYDTAISELEHREYRLALDTLERLIVQRLLELTKLGMSGLGLILAPSFLCSLLIICFQATNFEKK